MSLGRPFRRPTFSRLTWPAMAVIGFAALLGAAVGTGAAMMRSGPDESSPPTETSVLEEAPPTTVVESGFWTAIIESVPSDRPNAEAEAEQVAASARDKGQDAFVLDGGQYGGLDDDYLAVCVGRFEDQAAASDLRSELRQQGFSGAYHKNVGDLDGAGG
jgi:SPOR domain